MTVIAAGFSLRLLNPDISFEIRNLKVAATKIA
jgi:hypothetical protein